MLKKIKKEQFDDFFEILTHSFPKSEYRTYDAQLALFKQQNYQVYISEKKNDIEAVFAQWEGPNFIYLEHFAVKESYRNHGIGSVLLQEYIQQQVKPIILEIEPPESGYEKRRSEFYLRNSFKLNHWQYIQPAYSVNTNPVPLVLMSYPSNLTETDFYFFKHWVFKHVYQEVGTEAFRPEK